MHQIGLVFFCLIGLCLHATPISINQTFVTDVVYNDDTLYNIVSFHYVNDETSLATDSDQDSLVKLGITTADHQLVDIIWEYQSISNHSFDAIIQSVELLDMNNDNQRDIIIHHADVDGNDPDQMVSSFLIRQDNQFQEVPETFEVSQYDILDNRHIRYRRSFSLFGQPYEDENETKGNYWVDYYEFQGVQLVNVNQKYRDDFKRLRKDARKKLKTVLGNIYDYGMSDDMPSSQFQLEEYFNEVTELKTIIYRSNQVLD